MQTKIEGLRVVYAYCASRRGRSNIPSLPLLEKIVTYLSFLVPRAIKNNRIFESLHLAARGFASARVSLPQNFISCLLIITFQQKKEAEEEEVNYSGFTE